MDKLSFPKFITIFLLTGPAVLAGLLLMILIVPINIFMVQKTRQLRIKQMKFKDDRIKVINEVLSGVKVGEDQIKSQLMLLSHKTTLLTLKCIG